MRHAWVLLVLAALAMKIAVPPGFMIGSDFVQPAVMLVGPPPVTMGPVTIVAAASAQAGVPHQGRRPCAFAERSRDTLTVRCRCLHAAPLAIQPDVPLAALLVPIVDFATLAMPPVVALVPIPPVPNAAPGRGMAAPPPRSHAPPSPCA